MNFLDQVQHYWFIIIFTGTVIASWVRYEGKIDSLKSKMKDDKEDYAKEVKELRDRIRAVEIKAASIDSIAGDIKGINAKLDILLKKADL